MTTIKAQYSIKEERIVASAQNLVEFFKSMEGSELQVPLTTKMFNTLFQIYSSGEDREMLILAIDEPRIINLLNL